MADGSQVLVVVAVALVVEAAARCRCRRHHHHRCRRRTAHYVGVGIVIDYLLDLVVALVVRRRTNNQTTVPKESGFSRSAKVPSSFYDSTDEKSEFSIVNKNEKFGSLK